ncbi:hypothetical protein [Curtobacterium sp. ISL-83]|uniref:hypothetical protein n=1 Tax=Curtobacterium sp. ISL-83 TaxID=2819145 RepID=UPI001BE8FA62|nr:hypothetical protein [Curtobacterium sp. ISL-83]MBT2502999.1 hypothetical protein [Curtobacterium sp. ISL-83]
MTTRAELRRQRDDALTRAETAERELQRISELHFATVGFLSPSEYEQIGATPDGTS